MVLHTLPGTGARPGLTLMEVLVSLAIFLLSLVALGQLVSMAGDRALEVQERSRALQIAQSKLAEVTVGAIPLSGSGESAVEEDNNYQWSLSAEQGTVQGLWNVTVTVTRPHAAGRKLQVSLSQMILDPSVVGSTQDVPGGAAATSSSSGSGTSSGTNSSSPAGSN